MLFFKRHKKSVIWTTGTIVILIMLIYIFATYTSQGRIMALYTVAGWHAPTEIRQMCKQDSFDRVQTLFTQPLNMSEEAKNGLKEYWHYSYYRECLYRDGYSFMGRVLSSSSIIQKDDKTVYTNFLAGIVLTIPYNSSLEKDNELDVSFDYRLLGSMLNIENTEITIDTYTEHQFIHTNEDILPYINHFPSSTSTITHTTSKVTQTGVPYIFAYQNDSLCGAILVSPDERIIHIYSDCSNEELVHKLVGTVTFIPAVSVH